MRLPFPGENVYLLCKKCNHSFSGPCPNYGIPNIFNSIFLKTLFNIIILVSHIEKNWIYLHIFIRQILLPKLTIQRKFRTKSLL
jgi:hypothetical protein